MPVLSLESAAASLVSNVNTAGSGHVKDRQSEDSYDQQQREKEPEGFQEKMPFYPPGGAVKSGAPNSPFADGPATSSPKLTAPDSKRKQGLFSTKKPKALDRPDRSPSSVLTSPLPVTTPSKAAQFFGIEAKPKVTDSPRRGRHQNDGITDDDAPIGVERQAKFKEEDVGPDLSKPTKAGKSNANKGLRMLIPDFAGPRRAPIQKTTAAATRFDLDENDDDDVGYNSDSGLQEPRFRIPAAPRPVPVASKHRMNKKGPKPFQSMSPIPEASFESLRRAYREGEDITELGVISEYEYDDAPYSAPMLPRSHTALVSPPQNVFELEEEDLSPTDRLYDADATSEDDHTVHPGTKVDVGRVHWQQPTTFATRSPLQDIEDAYLDATEEEMRLEARRMTLSRIETEKRAMDKEIAILRREHEKLKLGLEIVSANNEAGPELDTCSEEEDEDLVSLRSSIDLDEEPTVHEAKVMTFTRITPGMVKLVDIPPRKKKAVPIVGNSTPVIDKLTVVEREMKNNAASAHEENVPPPVAPRYHHGDQDRTLKPKKSKMTRDESRLLVENWVSDYNSTEQRPLSTRVDPDVLADQETPPAPFPKSDEGLPTPPIQPRSDSLKFPKRLQKHQCINNGHIFYPVDLKHIPDDAVVNSLEVRPYLQTYTGIKQHVKIAVLCEKCGEDCNENIWECEIAVCRMVVCQSCAEDMEAEWQERAVSGWKYK
ncbi:hypothetical protein EJ07DRAFT_171309 [Lizonia empirigonia]|nr:hypothetical protein EJ07DRAFT_171309 [Lizonia empirigonia]